MIAVEPRGGGAGGRRELARVAAACRVTQRGPLATRGLSNECPVASANTPASF